jgi:hypothetical protein
MALSGGSRTKQMTSSIPDHLFVDARGRGLGRSLTSMKQITVLLLSLGIGSAVQAENRTDTSLFMKPDSSAYQTEIQSKSGDLYVSIGHHGPAVENEWMALRIYFDQKGAIDVYNKAKPGLELKEYRWYPDAEKQKAGAGADYYKVGKTIGLGGVRLWDGKKVVMLHPVSMRTAKVVKKEDSSVMEMISEGVPYKGRKVDILVRVTVKSGVRFANVEAEVLNGGPVQFVTGINYHAGLEIQKRMDALPPGEHIRKMWRQRRWQSVPPCSIKRMILSSSRTTAARSF